MTTSAVSAGRQPVANRVQLRQLCIAAGVLIDDSRKFQLSARDGALLLAKRYPDIWVWDRAQLARKRVEYETFPNVPHWSEGRRVDVRDALKEMPELTLHELEVMDRNVWRVAKQQRRFLDEIPGNLPNLQAAFATTVAHLASCLRLIYVFEEVFEGVPLVLSLLALERETSHAP